MVLVMKCLVLQMVELCRLFYYNAVIFFEMTVECETEYFLTANVFVDHFNLLNLHCSSLCEIIIIIW
jgi:hypothetical protein